MTGSAASSRFTSKNSAVTEWHAEGCHFGNCPEIHGFPHARESRYDSESCRKEHELIADHIIEAPQTKAIGD